ncbi:uncharacterized protein LOC127254787 isoform X2 [Andrographis paniculata]|nr:uncharacterized protein LOC127254787 isoform X2 [Andrographis paniculata]
MALQSYPQICLKRSIVNAEKSPLRVSMPCALSMKSERMVCLLRSSINARHPLSTLRVRMPFEYSFSNSRKPLNFPSYGITHTHSSTYFVSTTKTFFQVPVIGSLNYVVHAKSASSWRSCSFETFNKHKKWPKACSPHEQETFKLQATSSSSEDRDELSLLVSSTVKDEDNSTVIKRARKPKSTNKVAPKSRSTKKQHQSTHGEAADAPDSSKKVTGARKTRNIKNKQSSIESNTEFNSTTGIQTEEADKNISKKNGAKKAVRSSAKKGKSDVNGHSVLKSDTELIGENSSFITKAKSQDQKTWPQLYPPVAKTVLVVESVTKAKVIQGYVGEMFEVLPSYGHVRDLAARSGSVRPDNDFSMVWEVPTAAWSHLKSIKAALSGAKNLLLASDPDREGEAIAWHIIEMLQQQDVLHEGVTVARVVFNEITESSIKSALQSPREIDADLVNAYLARRALDYLIGFNISPLLWRKLPGCQSAGRVQSAALALICDREKEIDEFKAQEYWTIGAQFQKENPNADNNVLLSSHLTHFDSKRLSQLSISSNAEAKGIEEQIFLTQFQVVGSKTSNIRRNPPTPYITSTLQQDASNKLNFSASYTMKVAQKLYEGVQLSDDKATGLITYMRTDGVQLSNEAANDILSFVGEKYGRNFAVKSPRKYFKKVKNSQEAHEAIRPTDIRRLPSMLVGVLDDDSLRLYTLIWSRTMACQMEPAIIEQIQCDIGNDNNSIIFRSSCSRVEFPGFQAAYNDLEMKRTRNNEDDEDHRYGAFEVLSSLVVGESLSLAQTEPQQHYTQPPSRYSEGSLVKMLEELGIGRPSTYATTIKVLKDRKYITSKGRTLYPEFRGRMVSAFLSHYFSEVTAYSFTADMETELDNISAGITDGKGFLKGYWARFSKYCESVSDVHIRQVEKLLEQTFSNFLFSSCDGNRICPSCGEGTLVFKVSRFGAGYFLGCDKHPKCKYIAKALCSEDDAETDPELRKDSIPEPKLLGLNPETNEKVLLKKGPYGYYVQLGEDGKGNVPKRASVSRIKDVESITLEDALELLKYPVTLGSHPDDNQPVVLKIGGTGFNIWHRRTFASVPKNLKPDEISLEKALKLLQSKNVRRSGRPKSKNVATKEPVEAT